MKIITSHQIPRNLASTHLQLYRRPRPMTPPNPNRLASDIPMSTFGDGAKRFTIALGFERHVLGIVILFTHLPSLPVIHSAAHSPPKQHIFLRHSIWIGILCNFLFGFAHLIQICGYSKLGAFEISGITQPPRRRDLPSFPQSKLARAPITNCFGLNCDIFSSFAMSFLLGNGFVVVADFYHPYRCL